MAHPTLDNAGLRWGTWLGTYSYLFGLCSLRFPDIRPHPMSCRQPRPRYDLVTMSESLNVSRVCLDHAAKKWAFCATFALPGVCGSLGFSFEQPTHRTFYAGGRTPYLVLGRNQR